MKSLPNRLDARGFSIVELMVAMSILSVLMLMLTALLDQIQKSWRFSEARISQFREARVAFDLMAKNIGQASLNTYWDVRYDNEGMIEGYVPTSELHFVTMTDADQRLPAGATQTPMGHAIFFQAPLGFSTQFRNLNNLFNGRGYFVSWGSDKRFKPSFVNSGEKPGSDVRSVVQAGPLGWGWQFRGSPQSPRGKHHRPGDFSAGHHRKHDGIPSRQLQPHRSELCLRFE
jgi:prepilin-type N-terminal cleavage/methylation domain-containing protein